LVRSARFLALCIALLATLGASAQAWKGMGRLQGTVVDANGKPVQGAKVVLLSVRDNGGPTVTTDAKGKWAALGLGTGKWNIDVQAEGFKLKQTSIDVSELSRIPPMKIELEPLPPPEPPKEEAPAQESIQVGGVEISPEIAQAIETGNTALREKKWNEAAAAYEKALAVLTTNTSLKFALSRAYYGAGQLDKAIARLQEVYAADTGNVTAATLLGDMLLEAGKVDEASKVLNALPAGAVTDVNTLINFGIRLMNQNKSDLALKYLNDAVGLAPDVAAAYYYRGLAYLQLKKMAEAKADLKKVVEMGPDSSEAKDAKELLAQIK